MEVKPVSQHGCMAAGSGGNASDVVAGAILYTLARWLHHQYASVKPPLAGAYCLVT